MDQTISPEAFQAFKLDYANKCLLLVEAQAEIGRLRADLSRALAATTMSPNTEPATTTETAPERQTDAADAPTPLLAAGGRPR